MFLFNPKSAWQSEKGLDRSFTDIFRDYMPVLVLIPAVASFIGFGFVGFSIGGFVRVSTFGWGLSQAISVFLNAYLSVLLSGWVIHMISPRFDCNVSMERAVAMVAFSYTPAWVAGIFNIIPSLSIIGIAGAIYSLYILYIGFGEMTGVSESKRGNYFIISLLLIIAVYFLLSIILEGFVPLHE